MCRADSAIREIAARTFAELGKSRFAGEGELEMGEAESEMDSAPVRFAQSEADNAKWKRKGKKPHASDDDGDGRVEGETARFVQATDDDGDGVAIPEPVAEVSVSKLRGAAHAVRHSRHNQV